jgi:uncharacterized protein YaaQ
VSEADQVDLLMVVFVMGVQADILMEKLQKQDFRFTQVDSSGGFLQERTTCLFIGFGKSKFKQLLALIRETCTKQLQYIPARMDVLAALQGQPVMIEAEMGGANIIVLEVEQFIQMR